MTHFQRVVKYIAIFLAFFLAFSIVVGGISLMAAIFGFENNSVLEEFYSVEISQDIDKVDIDISAASLKIVIGDRFSLSTNIGNLEASSENSRLYVKQKQRHVNINSGKSGEIIITVPENASFKSFDLDAGAGAVDIECLNAERVDMDMGAGALTLRGGVIGKMELDLGVGKTDLTAAIKGNSSINCGVGKTDINILGQKSDYSFDIDTGIGSIMLENTIIGRDEVIGDGQYKIDIDGGVGSVNIDFINE